MIRNKHKYRSISKMPKSNVININFIAIIIIFILGFTFLWLGINFSSELSPLYNYEITKDSNYEVLLKPNNFYTESLLPSNLCYASQSINAFKINFKYDFKGSRETNFKYNYSITANLVATVKNGDNQGKEIWNRSFLLCENKINEQVNSNIFTINDQVDIDYEYYNTLSRSYETVYGVTIDSVLKLYFNVNYDINFTDVNISTQNISDLIELDIPITNTVTEVSKNYDNVVHKNIMPSTNSFSIYQIIYYIIGGLLILIGIVKVIKMMIAKNNDNPEQIYENNIKRILKYYKDIIVTITNAPDLSNLKVMDVAFWDDLIYVAEQNQCNIIQYEIKQKLQSNFYVIVNNCVYTYIVTSDLLK